MTTIISRLYSDAAAAEAVVAALVKGGQDPQSIHVITRDAPGGAGAAMQRARIGETAAAAYDRAMSGHQALLVVEVGFNPVGAARNALKIVGRHPALNVGLASEDRYIRNVSTVVNDDSVMKSHPLLMSNPFRTAPHGHVFGENPVTRNRTSTSAIAGGGYMSRMFWPMKLVSSQRDRSSAIAGGRLFSKMFGIPLLFGR